jgi:transposase
MVKYTPDFKHKVLRDYTPGTRGHSFSDLALRYGIRGGKPLISKWYRQWDGTASSLERHPGSGRRALLTKQQVQRYIVKPIRRANQSHVAIEYPDLKEDVELKTSHSISLRSIQRYGKTQGGITCNTTQARTEQERKYIYNINHPSHCVVCTVLRFEIV